MKSVADSDPESTRVDRRFDALRQVDSGPESTTFGTKHSEYPMFAVTNQWLLFVLDVSLKSLILAIAAGFAMKLLRVRDSNLRHRIWSSVLLGMLALPLLSHALPIIPVSIPESWATAEPEVPPAGSDVEPSFSSFGDSFAVQPGPSLDSTMQTEVVSGAGSTNDVAAVDLPLETESEPETATAPIARPWARADYVRVACITMFVVWLSVAAFFALRLIAGLWTTSRLRRRAKIVTDDVMSSIGTAVDGGTSPDCSHDVRELGISSTTVRESVETAVPVTIGWFRPTVLLPTEWRTWKHEKLRAIIAHELTHVVRRDFLVTLGAELNRCLYWFHPLSWWLRTRLSHLAEEACDDAAIGQTGDRTGYARHLLEVAAQVGRSSGRVIQPGLAMARESNVESRIATILDLKRPLSERVTWKTVIALVVVGLPVIAATAAVHPVKSAQDASVSTAKTTDDTSGTVRVHGQVTDENGKPIANANVSVWRVHRPNWYASDNISTKVGDLTVDANGRFDQSFPKSQLPEADSYRGGQWSVLVAESKGHAVAAMKGQNRSIKVRGETVEVPNFLSEQVTLKLAKSVPIRGKLVSLEGLPIVGAKVEIYRVDKPDPEAVSEWLKQADKQPKQENGTMLMVGASPNTRYFPSRDLSLPLGAIDSVTTGSDGAFEVPDLISRDGLAVLRVTHETIAYKFVHVIGREMKSVYGHGVTMLESSVQYFGQNPTVITAPSVPVEGVVRDIETKKPLANAWVAVGSVYDTTMSQSGLFRSKTDARGRYRIEGLPLVPASRRNAQRGNVIEVRPATLPYIETDFTVPAGNSNGPIKFDLELRRAVMARGRLTNKKTGEPIAEAKLYYSPYKTNENCGKYARYSDQVFGIMGNDTRYHSDKNGYFRIPVIPGRGVISARVDKGSYVAGYGAKGIDAFKKKDGRPVFTNLSDGILPSSHSSLVEINVPDGATTHEVTMEVDPGISVVAKFVDPNGKPLSGVEGSGLTSDRRWNEFQGTQVTVPALEIGGVRAVHVSHKQAKLALMTGLIPQDGQSEIRIQLLPYGRMTGRIVDPEGRPIADATIQAQYRTASDSGGILQHVQTDKEGRFTYELPVGVNYTFRVRIEDSLRRIKGVDLSEKPKQIDFGNLVYDEYAERFAELKPGGKAKVTAPGKSANE